MPSTGWIPPNQRTPEQIALDEEIKATLLRPFGTVAPKAKSLNPGDEYCLYRAFAGEKAPYALQSTGSCVGAGGYNALITLQKSEIVSGEAEEFKPLYWPFTYGVSRRLAGMNSKGEGSFGSAWFQAIDEHGMPSHEYPELPRYQDRDGWKYLDPSIELDWSLSPEYEREWGDEALEHPIDPEGVAEIKGSIDLLDAALTNGYPCTIASMYGTNTIREKDGLMVAKWDSEWAHQMFVDGVKNVKGNIYYRIGNNWGPNAHPQPIDDSPPGGFWVPRSDMAKNLRHQYTECFALSNFKGFPARPDDFWNTILDLIRQVLLKG